MSMDLIDVVRVAREFSEEAGWGFFKVLHINYDTKKGEWSCKARLGAFTDILMEFTIKDSTQKVIAYGKANTEEE